jgi:K+/H+ antiporter YhaU regulatory subunit KhtT
MKDFIKMQRSAARVSIVTSKMVTNTRALGRMTGSTALARWNIVAKAVKANTMAIGSTISVMEKASFHTRTGMSILDGGNSDIRQARARSYKKKLA